MPRRTLSSASRPLTVFRFAYGALLLYSIFLFGALLFKHYALVPDALLDDGPISPLERLLRVSLTFFFILLPFAVKGIGGWKAASGCLYLVILILLAEDHLFKEEITFSSVVIFLFLSIVIWGIFYYSTSLLVLPFVFLFSLFSSSPHHWRGTNVFKLIICLFLMACAATYYFHEKGINFESVSILIMLFGFLILLFFRSGFPAKREEEEEEEEEEEYYEEECIDDSKDKNDDYLEWIREAAKSQQAEPTPLTTATAKEDMVIPETVPGSWKLFDSEGDLKNTVNVPTSLRKTK